MGFLEYLLMFLLFFLAAFLIVLVLIQRGKGGGLAGAFGGLGGQSAFGTKAGDVFTRVTIGVAAAWIVLCIISLRALGLFEEHLDVGPPTAEGQPSPVSTAPADQAPPASDTSPSPSS